jgi:hypothetical protein
MFNGKVIGPHRKQCENNRTMESGFIAMAIHLMAATPSLVSYAKVNSNT